MDRPGTMDTLGHWSIVWFDPGPGQWQIGGTPRHRALDIPRQAIPSLVLTTSELRAELANRPAGGSAVAELMGRIDRLSHAAA